MRTRIIHYWTGYGSLCMTADGRRNDAQCDADPQKVTCERCNYNLQVIGKLPKPRAYVESDYYIFEDMDGRFVREATVSEKRLWSEVERLQTENAKLAQLLANAEQAIRELCSPSEPSVPQPTRDV